MIITERMPKSFSLLCFGCVGQPALTALTRLDHGVTFMMISHSGWVATRDNMPSTQGRTLHVSGTVTVRDSGVQACLTPRGGPQPKDLVLRLNLELKASDEPALQVLTQREVRFSTTSHWLFVEVFHDDVCLVRIPFQDVH